MSREAAFNSTVAARTRTAENILRDKELLALYIDAGGLKDDLETIAKAGHRAEAMNHAQSSAQATGNAATEEVLTAFVQLQKDYRGIMAVVQAVLHDLRVAEAGPDLIAAVEKILANEAEVSIRTLTGADGKKKKKVSRSISQEALRAEIAKDAAALLDLKEIHAQLHKRRVEPDRLSRLQEDATELSGKLAERVSKKGAGKASTNDERQAVAAQSERWRASYRILAHVGHQDARIASLLKDAARKK